MLPTAGSRGEPAKAITLPPPPLLIMDIFTKQIWAADLYSQLKTVFEVSPEKSFGMITLIQVDCVILKSNMA